MATSGVAAPTGARGTAVSAETMAMGNRFVMTVVDADDDVANGALALARRLDALWSRFRADSDITALNLAEGEPRRVDPLTSLLIREMLEAHQRTGGDYDPTLLPTLVEGYRSSRLDPTLSTLLPASARAPGDLTGVRIGDDTVALPRGTTLDPGGIGKGLAADLAVRYALDRGAEGALAQFGGDVAAAGRAPDGIAWRIGVEDPFHPTEHCDIVRLVTGGVATSSTRRLRWNTLGGGSAHHLIDPRTAASIPTDIQTVTVIAASGARAESLTKSGFLRPLADYLAWLPTQGAAGLAITAEGAMHTSPNWSTYR